MALSDDWKRKADTAAGSVSAAIACFRCGANKHSSRECPQDFASSWLKGRGAQQLDGNDVRQAAEIYWGAKLEEHGVTPAFPTPKIPIVDNDVGKIERNTDIVVKVEAPNAIEEGIYETDATSLGPGPTEEEFTIMSNYVKVKKIPDTLYVYSLKYWYLKQNSDESSDPEEFVFKKRREIQSAFQALHDIDAFGLKEEEKQPVYWATDYKDLWCSSAISKLPSAPKATFDTDKAPFLLINGRKIENLQATVSFSKILTNLTHNLKTDFIADLDEPIRALNALVARSIRQQQSSSGQASAATQSSLIQVGANKFYVHGGHEDMGGLCAMRGYYTSVRSADSDVLLNVNTATSPFLAPTLVSDFIANMPVHEKEKQRVGEKLLSGALVRVVYHRQNYEDSGVDLNDETTRAKTLRQFGVSASQQKFYGLLPKDKSDPKAARVCDPNDPQGTSVQAYLQQQCNVNLKDYHGPFDKLCVNVGNKVDIDDSMQEQSAKGAVWIPACLLEIQPNQLVKGVLHTEHVKKMIGLALRLPGANASLIVEEGLKLLGIRNGPTPSSTQLSDNGFELESNLISFTAKTLVAPNVEYAAPRNQHYITQDRHTKSEDYEKQVDPIQASWDLRDVAFARTNPINRLKVMGRSRCFYNATAESELAKLQTLHTDFQNKLTELNIGSALGSAEDMEMRTDRNLAKTLHEWFSQCAPNDHTLILLKAKDFDQYAEIKRSADLVYGSHTLCAVGPKIKEFGFARSQHLSNLALKINMKTGGTNHFLDRTSLDTILGNARKDTIILGADVTHPGPGTQPGCPSIACIVGSVDSDFMNYPGSMRLQAGRQEIIDEGHMRSMIKERIEAWQKHNQDVIGQHRLPTSILFYRDGLSESQFAACESEEIQQIREAYKVLGGKIEDMKITFVVVGKRHHTRFYPTSKDQSYESLREVIGADRQPVKDPNNKRQNLKEAYTNGNLKPGLLVDKVVTNASPPNFFLQSHCAIKGTARSAHYHVLLDEMQLWPKDLPMLTLVLCCAFGRATKAVSYVAPAYIADRLCERGRAYLRPWNARGRRFDRPPAGLDKEGMRLWKKERALDIARHVTLPFPQAESGASDADALRGPSGRGGRGGVGRGRGGSSDRDGSRGRGGSNDRSGRGGRGQSSNRGGRGGRGGSQNRDASRGRGITGRGRGGYGPLRRGTTDPTDASALPNDAEPRVWGNYNDDQSKGDIRLNPWHPNLDDGMFWM